MCSRADLVGSALTTVGKLTDIFQLVALLLLLLPLLHFTGAGASMVASQPHCRLLHSTAPTAWVASGVSWTAAVPAVHGYRVTVAAQRLNYNDVGTCEGASRGG